MEIHLFTDPTEDVIEFRGLVKRFVGKDLIVFQFILPVTTFEETSDCVFEGNDVSIVVKKDFFRIREGKRDFYIKEQPITNIEGLCRALRGQVSQNPVEEQQVVEDEPRNYRGGRRVQTFRTSSKRVSKNGRRLTRKPRHGRWQQHGQH